MRKIFFKCMLIAGIVSLAACSSDKFLEENLYGKLFPESFYNNEAELEMANNALYRPFSKSFHAYYTTLMRMLYSGDDITSPGAQADHYVYTSADADIASGWRFAYETINIANGILDNYRRAEGTVSEEKLLRYAGQAHFARAYMYFWLVRIFNKIPYISTVRVLDRDIELSPPEEIYKHIIEDLKLAEEYLPETWNGIDQLKYTGGAVTKGAAKATLAMVYLTTAGYPVKDNEGYRLAKEKAAEIITNEARYGYRLLDHCAELWRPLPKLHDEMVFAFVYDGTIDYNVAAPAYNRPSWVSGAWGGVCSEINFFLRFPAGERKEATFLYEFPLENGRIVQPWPQDKPLTSWENEPYGHPYYNKMWDTEESQGDTKWTIVPSGQWRCSRTNQMIRYAEVLLIYAEAQAMADNGPNDLAYECINRVRNRAFKGVGSNENNLPRGLSAQAFRDSVFVERGWEFAGFEFASRWFDLVRFELVEDAIKEQPVNTFLPGRNARDGRPISAPSKPASYFHPLPDEDAKLNSNFGNQFN